MKVVLFKYAYLILFFNLINQNLIFGQENGIAHISGRIMIDSTWGSTLYLSHIPTFENMYEMSSEMIIAKTEINSLGNFDFFIDFLPCRENLYRLHITKRGDSPATLIIGGKDENHFFLIIDCDVNIHVTNVLSNPPFRNIAFQNSEDNSAFQKISSLVSESERLAAESSASKRELLEEKLNEKLLLIADTSQNFLVSLYAIYKSSFESNYYINNHFFASYLQKWEKQDNEYFNSFRKQLPSNSSKSHTLFLSIFICSILSVVGYYFGIFRLRQNKRFQKLSIQERKIFELLRQGSTNQEISDQFNIGLSTVKSHVSSIYSKLNIKSRKDILNLKIK